MPQSRGPADLFPQRLREARELRELSQADLAKKATLQPSAVSHFETGTRRPSFANLRRLADALAVSIDFLLGRSNSISGTAQTADVLYRDIEKLSARDREVVGAIARQMAEKKRGKKDGDDS